MHINATLLEKMGKFHKQLEMVVENSTIINPKNKENKLNPLNLLNILKKAVFN